MWETIAVVVIVAAAAAFIMWSLWRIATGKGEVCNCSSAGSCPMARSGDECAGNARQGDDA
jgi:hypothetical protein